MLVNWGSSLLQTFAAIASDFVKRHYEHCMLWTFLHPFKFFHVSLTIDQVWLLNYFLFHVLLATKISIMGIFIIRVPFLVHRIQGFSFCYLPNIKFMWNKFKWKVLDNSNYDNLHGGGDFSHAFVIIHKYFG